MADFSDYDLRGRTRKLPTVQVIEPRTGPWQNNVQWGTSISGFMPTTPGVEWVFDAGGTVLSRVERNEIPVATNDILPGPPAIHTVQLFRGDFRPQLNSDVYAKVTYFIGGTSNSFLVDWGPGCQFSLAANRINVNGISFAPNMGSFAVPVAYSGGGLPLNLGVTFAKGTIAHGRPLLMTEPMRAIATNTAPPAAGSFFIPIPDFARAVIVRAIRTDAGATNLTRVIASEQSQETGLQITLESQFGLTIVDAQIFAGLGEQGFPIPGGANRIVIGNVSNLLPVGHRNLNADYRFVIQWVLSL